MASQRDPRTSRRRPDHKPSVRPFASPPGDRQELRPQIRRQSQTVHGPYHVLAHHGTIAAGETTRQDARAALTSYALRIVRLVIWCDTADLEIVEAYFGSDPNLAAAGIRGLFQEPLDTAYSKFTYSATVGTGPVGQIDDAISLRRTTATSGQTLYYMLWSTQERAR